MIIADRILDCLEPKLADADIEHHRSTLSLQISRIWATFDSNEKMTMSIVGCVCKEEKSIIPNRIPICFMQLNCQLHCLQDIHMNRIRWECQRLNFFILNLADADTDRHRSYWCPMDHIIQHIHSIKKQLEGDYGRERCEGRKPGGFLVNVRFVFWRPWCSLHDSWPQGKCVHLCWQWQQPHSTRHVFTGVIIRYRGHSHTCFQFTQENHNFWCHWLSVKQNTIHVTDLSLYVASEIVVKNVFRAPGWTA